MYRAVPPPEQSASGPGREGPPPEQSASGPGREDPPNSEAGPLKPANISTEQWKRFQDLRSRREEECGRAAKHRIAAVRNTALKAVRKELSELDRSILRDEGLSLPQGKKRRRGQDDQPASSSDEKYSKSLRQEARWQEVKKYLDPNPHLKGVEAGRPTPKSKLEEEMDSAIERKEFGTAVPMSDKMAQREFATRVATAFDCQECVKKKKIMEQRKKGKKERLRQKLQHKAV